MRLTAATIVASVSISASVFAQAPVIEFDQTKHDFGTFKEEAGPQKHRFSFTNRGNSPLKLTHVQASCGCTTPSWTKEEIAPGKKGYVEAEYNPAGRPGAFEKTLTVMSNAQTPSVALTIKGNVTERVKTAADLYPREVGDFRLQSEYLNMGRVVPSKGENKQTFKIYNKSDKTVTFDAVNPSQPHLKMTISPATIKPEQTADITVVYDAKQKKEYGYTNDPVTVNYKGGNAASVQLYVVGTVEEEPRTVTEAEKGIVPKLKFQKKEHDFGTLRPGEVVDYAFEFTNSGSQNLEIFKTKASCGCTASDPSKKMLAKNESGNIKVTFNSTGKHDGPQSQTVTIYSNDPEEPTQYITIKANIDSKKPDMGTLLSAPKPVVASEAPAAKPAAKGTAKKK